jgi:hypothetical protein
MSRVIPGCGLHALCEALFSVVFDVTFLPGMLAIIETSEKKEG